MSFEKALSDEIGRLRHRLAELLKLEGKTRSRRNPTASKAPRKQKRKSSPKLRALRQQQGKYMGLVRGLTAQQKRKVSEIREKKGMRAAIAAAKRAGAAKK